MARKSGDRATIADWKSWSREESEIAGGRNGVGHYWPMDRMRYYSGSSGAVCSVGYGTRLISLRPEVRVLHCPPLLVEYSRSAPPPTTVGHSPIDDDTDR